MSNDCILHVAPCQAKELFFSLIQVKIYYSFQTVLTNLFVKIQSKNEIGIFEGAIPSLNLGIHPEDSHSIRLSNREEQANKRKRVSLVQELLHQDENQNIHVS